MHHLHLRKRLHKKGEKFPSPNKKIRILDDVIYIIGILGPAMTIPQILKILITQNASGVSFIANVSWGVFAGVWIVYGIVHKEKPIIITNVMWVILQTIISISVIIYGKGFF